MGLLLLLLLGLLMMVLLLLLVLVVRLVIVLLLLLLVLLPVLVLQHHGQNSPRLPRRKGLGRSQRDAGRNHHHYHRRQSVSRTVSHTSEVCFVCGSGDVGVAGYHLDIHSFIHEVHSLNSNQFMSIQFKFTLGLTLAMAMMIFHC